jgi:hypothetical protein
VRPPQDKEPQSKRSNYSQRVDSNYLGASALGGLTQRAVDELREILAEARCR